VLEISGLVTYAAADTREPALAAGVLLGICGIQHTFYMDGSRLIVRDSKGSAIVECAGDRLRYTPETCDVLGYKSVFDALRAAHKLDGSGYATRDDLFFATVDHAYPDALARLWNSFHGQVLNTPDLMFTTLDGYCAGVPFLENLITMKSTHGSLNQINSATFLMTMTGRTTRALRSGEVLPTIVPGYVPMVKAGR